MQYHYEVDGQDFSRAGTVSSSIKKILKTLGLPADRVKRTAIAVYEAEINMVIHAGGGATDVEIDADRVKIVMRDRGPGIPDIDKAMEAGFSTASNEARQLGFGAGMGLPNMKKNSDELKVESVVGEGTTVTILMHLKPVAVAEASV